MHYNYCPNCGAKLKDKEAGDDGKVPYCENCQKYWFDSFSSAVIILVANEENEIALLWQNYLSDKYANFISGYMQPGESAEESAAREVTEEIGLEPESLEYGGTYWFGQNDLLMHGFIAKVKKAVLKPSPEVDTAKWIPANEAKKYLFPDAPGNAQAALYRRFMVKIA